MASSQDFDPWMKLKFSKYKWLRERERERQKREREREREKGEHYNWQAKHRTIFIPPIPLTL